MASTTRTEARPIATRTLAVRGAIAVALSLVVNWIVLWVVLATDLVVPFDSLSYPPVTLFTGLGAIGATVVYWALTRASDSPDRTFTIVAAVVLVLSFLPDVGLLRADPNATVPAVIVLIVMHVTVAAICVGALTGRIR